MAGSFPAAGGGAGKALAMPATKMAKIIDFILNCVVGSRLYDGLLGNLPAYVRLTLAFGISTDHLALRVNISLLLRLVEQEPS